VDYSFDCTGIGANITLSLAAVRPGIAGTGVRGGTNVVVGIPRVPFELDSLQLINGEKALIGCAGGSCDPHRDFSIFVDWSLTGQFDPSALVTNRYVLNEINTAVDDLHHHHVSDRAVIML
jgi:Zn-dependent alcohol dehydrogenase